MTKITKKPVLNNNEEKKVVVAEISPNGEIKTFENPKALTVEEVQKRNDLLTKKIRDLNFIKDNLSFIKRVVGVMANNPFNPMEEAEDDFCIVLCTKSIADSQFRHTSKEDFSIVKRKEVVAFFSSALLTYTEEVKNSLEADIINH